jgi:predicted PurR-regulated permease PerM
VTLQKQVLIWAVSLGVLVVALWTFSPILLPFIAGLVLAYFLDPVADALQRLGFSRLAAALLIVILSILLLVVTLVILVPIVVDQLGRFAGDLPGIIQSLTQRFDELAPQWVKDALAKSGADVQGSVTQFAGKAAEWILSVLKTVLSGGLALVNLVSLMVVTPIVTFYLLVDWDDMVETVDGWVPREHLETVRGLGRDINSAMAGFIRGQGTVCLLLGFFYAVALSLAGLKFGLAIGLLAGALTFIPYAGALIGGVLAIGVALVQFWPDFWSIALVAAIFGAGQFLEGNFLSPKLVGKSVGLHPVWLMFALFAFGYAFGFVGLLLAVPLAAAAGVLVRFALRQYLASRLYLGASAELEAVPVPVGIIDEVQGQAPPAPGQPGA